MTRTIHLVFLSLIADGMGLEAVALGGAEEGRARRVQVGDTVVYELSVEDSEVVDVASAAGGSRIFVIAPASPEDGIARSMLVELVDRCAEADGGPEEVVTVDLGGGERSRCGEIGAPVAERGIQVQALDRRAAHARAGELE